MPELRKCPETRSQLYANLVNVGISNRTTVAVMGKYDVIYTYDA